MSFPSTGYMVVTATDRLDLEDDVKARIEEGWRPQGGVSISFRPVDDPMGRDESFVIYAQAMMQQPEAKT